VTPSFVVYGGKDRLVVDLRLINQFIHSRPFKYQRLSGFLSSLVPGEHLVSRDVTDAFYRIRILPAQRKSFRFIVSGVVYEPRVVPFGMRLSPWAWTKVLRPVVAAMRARGHKVNAYVYDFAATGRRGHPSTMADATAGRVEILSLFLSLGLQVHPTKGKRVGSRVLPFLSFLVDTCRRVLLLLVDRLGKLVADARAMLTSACRDGRRVRHYLLQRFTGTAVSCAPAVPSARFFLRRLFDAQSGADRAGSIDSPSVLQGVGPCRRRNGPARLSHGALEDLRWFSGLAMEPGVGRALCQPSVGVLTTDASPYGSGGHFCTLLPAAGFFTLAQREQHINL